MIEDALVIMPAYNEAKVIRDTLAELRAVAAAVLVVDDGSSDGTRELVTALGVPCLRLATNLNYGGALQAGFRYALRRTAFPYLVTFDADGQHDPAFLEALIRPLREDRADYVIGSRYLEAAGAQAMPRSRDLGIRLFARAASWALHKPVTDPTSGFTALTREVARVFLSDFFPQDYPDADVIIMLERMGFRLTEFPVTVRPSRSGKSMHGGLVKPIYYLAKMSVAMIHLATRRDLREKRKEAEIAA